MLEIKVKKTSKPKVKPEAAKLGFGKYFSDHMFIMDYKVKKGWHNARIVPFKRVPLHPASTVLHYGAEIFEGLKAYRKADGTVQMFRPVENARRMNSSAERMCLPEIPEDMFMEALATFVALEKDWTPSTKGASLYLRPFMFGNDETLGVHAVKTARFMIIASPVGSYYKEGINPVRIMIEDTDVRAVKGGTGHTKCGGNYAASTRAGEAAAKKGYAQVLWLDGIERKYIEEVGAMNVMFKINGEIVTPGLYGSILPGITRKSCIEVLKKEGLKVTERLISIDELIDALKSGALTEAFGCGTAAVISPIGEFSYKGVKYKVADGGIGKTTQMLYDTLTGIQSGAVADTYNWTYPVKTGGK